jgi:hypothetical protein
MDEDGLAEFLRTYNMRERERDSRGPSREYVVPELKLDPFAARLLSENQNLCCALGNLNTNTMLVWKQLQELTAAVLALVETIKAQRLPSEPTGSDR